MERNRIPAVIGALVGAVAYLLVGLLPSIVYGTYAGVLLAGGIVDVATATFWVKAFGVFGAILGVLGLGSLFVVLGAVAGALEGAVLSPFLPVPRPATQKHEA